MTQPNLDELKGRRIGRILTKMGKVSRDQIQEALKRQQHERTPLGQILVDLGYITDDDVLRALAAQRGMEMVDLDKADIPDNINEILPSETAQAYQVMPIGYDEESNVLTVAMKSPDNFQAVDDLQLLMGYTVKAVVAEPKQVDEFVARTFADDMGMDELIADMASDDTLAQLSDRGASIDLDTLVEAAEDNKVKRLLNLVLLQAIKDHASDIHLEPFENEFKIRYRVDGVLYEMVPPPAYLAPAIVSRVKVLARLDISEHRLPQDGRIDLTVRGNPVDLRVSVLPTINGESVVMRVLDRDNVHLDLERLGMREKDLAMFRSLMAKPNGIVIVTGPTGSGKTTTLYSALAELNTPEEKILTAEDPVEYPIDGMVQCPVNPDIGLTFARLLRSFLRQDPDIILVGEMRDLETAKIAVESALTGHLVFSTLHTNDAPASVARLVDLGMEPFLVTATLEAVCAQRLVRRICNQCKEEYEPTEEQLMELSLRPEDVQGQTFARGRGCAACNNTGFKGRVALYEIMVMDDDLRTLILAEASTTKLRSEARKRGMATLRDSGLLAIYDGLTTIDEVVRETMQEE